ncbi:hypothetical protein [Actinokineospora terrae]|uniref:Neocarzinostatin family protein n=1 Tax=Actinokineospora terrae TaxID=155974 RepID=A0A1H9WVA8_9PSEU|nr:hypothetical protein [Actinokineospora terrae]SES37627.1 hypothetical protein SAMN04487818_111238 [Actinokineospora terrae]
MSPVRSLRIGVLAVTTGLVAFAAPAGASVPADSSATVGVAVALVGTEAIDIGPLAPCAAGGPGIGTTTGQASDAGLVSYGLGSSTCSFDPATGASSATVNGRQFELNRNSVAGVPKIKIGTFSVSCHTNEEGGVSTSLSLGGVVGLDLPEEIPPNHTILVPGFFEEDPPIAKIVLNDLVEAEAVEGEAPDKSLTVHAAKIWLYPDADPLGPPTPGSGSITVGSVTCNPAHD